MKKKNEIESFKFINFYLKNRKLISNFIKKRIMK